jgi:eukaryotic-like serine/threonine-protein kinase
MALASGTRLGAYEITGLLGAGGMGEVYRATDTKLGRELAIKTLPASLATDKDRLTRFEREAKLLAALNHAHIASVYSLDEYEGTQYLAMELVEGETLEHKLKKGPFPVENALHLALQVAEALEAAHEKGVVHRDLKPANIMVTANDQVKVLDFGLAKAFSGNPNEASPLHSPVLSAAMTQQGLILGTAGYMSPEQASGQATDQRADIWAFGVVLYEMLTGLPLFSGESVPHILADVLRSDPDWSRLPENLHPRVRMLLERCLRKKVRLRYHSISDARIDIDDALDDPRGVAPGAETANERPRRYLMFGLAAVALAVAGVALGLTVWRTPPAAPQVVRALLDVNPAEDMSTGSTLGILPGGASTALAWSPDGGTLAFVGRTSGAQRIYLRDLGAPVARALDGTDGVRTFAFSPDGGWIAFWANGQLLKVRAAGGPVAKLCDTQGYVNGISWGTSRIVYSQGRQLLAVSPDGGTPRMLADPGHRVASPFLLPGDTAVLYTAYDKIWTSGDERVMVQPLNPGGAASVLLSEAADARYLPSGRLVFLRQGTLFVVSFDAGKLQIRGAAVAVENGVAQSAASWNSGDLTLAGQYAVSSRGALAYAAGPLPSLRKSEPVAVSREGVITSLSLPAAEYRERIESSPDGKSVAVSLQNTTSVRLRLYDVGRGTFTTPFAESTDRETVRPLWSSDGEIAVQIYQSGTSQTAVFNPASSAPPDTLSDSASFTPSSWSADGKLLFGSKNGDLWVSSYGADQPQWTPLTNSDADEAYATLSPDGHWLAYASDVSGRREVYIEPYPGPAAAIPVSTNGGMNPAWNPNGNELFYTEPHAGDTQDWRMISVDMTTPSRPGRPLTLFAFSSDNLLLATCYPTACYSVAPDGQAFFALHGLPREPVNVTEIRLVMSWFEELERLVPTR